MVQKFAPLGTAPLSLRGVASQEPPTTGPPVASMPCANPSCRQWHRPARGRFRRPFLSSLLVLVALCAYLPAEAFDADRQVGFSHFFLRDIDSNEGGEPDDLERATSPGFARPGGHEGPPLAGDPLLMHPSQFPVRPSTAALRASRLCARSQIPDPPACWHRQAHPSRCPTAHAPLTRPQHVSGAFLFIAEGASL
jgi:hypothetical protein